MFKALKTCFTQSFKHMKMKALNTFDIKHIHFGVKDHAY